jgi:hypothetical protein
VSFPATRRRRSGLPRTRVFCGKWKVYVTDENIGEVLRVLDALQTDELCPCNSHKGDETLKAA